MFTVRGNRRAKALLRERFTGMGWQTGRLVAAMPDAYLLAYHLSTSPDIGSALSLWERGFRANVEHLVCNQIANSDEIRRFYDLSAH